VIAWENEGIYGSGTGSVRGWILSWISPDAFVTRTDPGDHGRLSLKNLFGQGGGDFWRDYF